jgi:hypothetical protein
MYLEYLVIRYPGYQMGLQTMVLPVRATAAPWRYDGKECPEWIRSGEPPATVNEKRKRKKKEDQINGPGAKKQEEEAEEKGKSFSLI